MKTERRHELQTNTLAQSLGEGIEKVRPYGNQILLAILAVIAVVVGVLVFRNVERANRASAWEAFFIATAPKDVPTGTEKEMLQEVAKTYKDSEMADWARLSIGDEDLSQASQLIITNKSEARSHLNAALEEYRPLASSSKVPEVRNLANYNIGICHEMLSQLDKAVESYRKVGGVLAKRAKERADKLDKDDDLKEFYDWFAKAEPPQREIPGGSMPGRMPPFEPGEPNLKPFSDVPGGENEGTLDNSPIKLFPEKTEGTAPNSTSGDVKLPGLDTPLVPSEPETPAAPDGTTPETPASETPDTAPAPAEPTGEAPASPTTAPAPEKTPAVPESPAAESPASEEKPTAEKPAESSDESPAPAPAESE